MRRPPLPVAGDEVRTDGDLLLVALGWCLPSPRQARWTGARWWIGAGLVAQRAVSDGVQRGRGKGDACAVDGHAVGPGRGRCGGECVMMPQ